MLLLRGETEIWEQPISIRRGTQDSHRCTSYGWMGLQERRWKAGERATEGGRERDIGRCVSQESEEERVCMNERAGITTSHVNAVPGNPGETKKCTVPPFLWQSPYTLMWMFTMQRHVQTCLPHCLAGRNSLGIIKYERNLIWANKTAFPQLFSSFISYSWSSFHCRKSRGEYKEICTRYLTEVHQKHLQIAAVVTFFHYYKNATDWDTGGDIIVTVRHTLKGSDKVVCSAVHSSAGRRFHVHLAK